MIELKKVIRLNSEHYQTEILFLKKFDSRRNTDVTKLQNSDKQLM